MSSLAAARADGFYYPPEFDASKHKSVNVYRKSHPLGQRARRLFTEGILVIRFEIPFKCVCEGCGMFIAKGVRFNARKRCVGSYFTTKIYEFAMNCTQCQTELVIHTDPQACEYVCVSGLRKKIEEYTAKDAGTADLESMEEIAERRINPMANLEYQAKKGHRNLLTEEERIDTLLHLGHEKFYDPYEQHRLLRHQLKDRKEREALILKDQQDKNFHLPLDAPTEEDQAAAANERFALPRAHLEPRKPIIARTDVMQSSHRLDKLRAFKDKIQQIQSRDRRAKLRSAAR